MTWLLALPVSSAFRYSPVQSLNMLLDARLLGVLYYVWLALVLFLLFTSSDHGQGTFEQFVLVVLFSVVFVGFFLLHAPYPGLRSEGSRELALARIIADRGTLRITAAIGYMDYPALGLLAATLAEVTGVAVSVAGGLLLLTDLVLLPVLLYLLFCRWLPDRRLAAFCSLLVIQANYLLVDSVSVTGQFFGALLVVGFLILLNSKLAASVSNRLGRLVLLAGTSVMHLLSAGAIVGSAIGSPDSQNGKSWRLDAPTVTLYAIIAIAWSVYWAKLTFLAGVAMIRDTIHAVSAGTILSYFFRIASVNLEGHGLPWWISVDRFVWLGMLVPGVIIGLWRVTSWRRGPAPPSSQSAEMMGVFIVSAIVGALLGAHVYIVRVLYYAPIFAFAILLVALVSITTRPLQRFLIGSLVGLFFVMSLPTFFADQSMSSVEGIHDFDVAAAQFLARQYGDGDGLTLYTGRDAVMGSGILYWVPRAAPQVEQVSSLTLTTASLWTQMNRIMDQFIGSAGPGRVFLWSPRIQWPYQHLFGLQPADPHWRALFERLQNYRRFYDNGLVQAYQPER